MTITFQHGQTPNFIHIDEATSRNLCVTGGPVTVQYGSILLDYSTIEMKCKALGIPSEYLRGKPASSYCEHMFSHESFAQALSRIRRRYKNDIFGDMRQFAMSYYTSKLKPKEKWPRMSRKKLMSTELLNLYKKYCEIT